MLTDSRTRQAGFIRNSSSRKILHQPEQQKKKNSHSSDDSFSSFQYDGNSKMSYQSKKPQAKNLYGQYGQVKSVEKRIVKPPSPYIPPKPQKKPQIKQPSFTNQRLKNNFFHQPLDQSKSIQKYPPVPRKTKQSFPRVPTPQFQQNSFKHDIEQVQNICSRIEGMKLIQGNFSFNPKTNKFKKEREFIEKESQLKNISQNEQQMSEIVARKPKQNNYFNEDQNHKFQYDFESSSSSDNDEQAQQQEQSFGNHSQQEDHDQAINFYQQQQKRKSQQPQITKTVSKNNFPQNYQQSHSNQSQNYSKRVQNQQSEDNNQELITDYNKTDFGMKLTQQMRRDGTLKNQQKKQIEQQQGVIQKHGGICFEVDVKQFNQGTGNNLTYQSTKKGHSQANKKKKVNEKQQLLKRRQMAKIYSKQARFRLFGFA